MKKDYIAEAEQAEIERTRSVLTPEEYERWKALSEKTVKMTEAELAEYDALERKRLQTAPPLTTTANSPRRGMFYYVLQFAVFYLSANYIGPAIAKEFENAAAASLIVAATIVLSMWFADKLYQGTRKNNEKG